MSRARFRKGEQINFFGEVLRRNDYTLTQLADRCGIVSRTLNDWMREKYLPNYETIQSLGKEFGISLEHVEKLDSYWYVRKGAKKGGKIRYQLYGLLGTIKDRVKGGRVSQQHRREYPEKYRRLGCIVKKEFQIPHHSEKLAELMGIIMGDGSINDYQVRITLDRNADREYAVFVQNLMHRVFGERPSWIERREDNTIMLTISGAGLVEVLERIGLRRGNKVVHQINFPRWLQSKPGYRIACVRGLFDTDGGLYFHKKGRKLYLGWCFANSSKPLLQSVMDVLLSSGFNVKKSGEHKLYMYSLEHIGRYMRVVGSNNPKNAAKLKLRMEQDKVVSRRRGA